VLQQAPNSSLRDAAKRGYGIGVLTRRWFWFVAIVLLTFAMFSPLIRADFTAWDDPDTLALNPKLHPPTWDSLADYWTTAGDAAPMGLYVPVTYTVWSAASIPNGPSPHVIHAINVSLHAVTAGLVFLLLRRFVPTFPALVGSAIFALHSVQVEAVGWASGTKDLLCGFFAVATLLIETAPGRSRWMRTVAFGCFVLAMLSKPTAMVVPVMLVAWDVFRSTGGPPVPGARGTGGTSVLRRMPWLAAAAICGIVTAMSQPVPWQPTLPLWTRPVVALDAIAFYLHKLVWPAHLCMDYGRTPTALFDSPSVWWTWAVPIVAAGAMFLRPMRAFDARSAQNGDGVCFGDPETDSVPVFSGVHQKSAFFPDLMPISEKRGRSLFWRMQNGLRPRFVMNGLAGGAGRAFLLAAAWFVLPLLPVLGLLPFDFQYFSTVADHYLYLSMIGVALAVAAIIPARPGWKLAIPGAVVAAVLCVLTVRQEQSWMDTSSLANQAIAVNPKTFAGHDLLGYEHRVKAIHAASADVAAAERSAAIAEYKLALSNNPTYVPSLTNLAYVQHQDGRLKEALETLHRLVELQPSLPPRLRADPTLVARQLLDYGDPAGAARWMAGHAHAAASP
jgi:hypothetical protein